MKVVRFIHIFNSNIHSIKIQIYYKINKKLKKPFWKIERQIFILNDGFTENLGRNCYELYSESFVNENFNSSCRKNPLYLFSLDQSDSLLLER